MNKTNTGLVDYAKAQLGKPYWYGTFGQNATAQLYEMKDKQYPKYYSKGNYKTGFSEQYGQRVHDCVGLIKGYLWSDSATTTPRYNSSQDVSANGMKNACKEKGNIKTIPETPGILVFFDGHVGIYIGNGYVIEARGHDYGVVKTKLSDRPWTSWGKCPWIDYTAKPTTPVSEKTNNYYPRYTGNSISIVDALKAMNVDSSFANRTKIARANGITLYAGTATQNTKLLLSLKAGTLKKPD